MSGTERAGLFDALKTVLSSPVGGWALAVLLVGYMAWLTHSDLKFLRETAMPTITEGPRVGFQNQELLRDIKEMVGENNNLLLEIRRNQMPGQNKADLNEILRMLKEAEKTPE